MFSKGARAVTPSEQDSDAEVPIVADEEREEDAEPGDEEQSRPPSLAEDSDDMPSSPPPAPKTNAKDAGNGFTMLHSRILLGRLFLAFLNEGNLNWNTSHTSHRF